AVARALSLSPPPPPSLSRLSASDASPPLLLPRRPPPLLPAAAPTILLRPPQPLPRDPDPVRAAATRAGDAEPGTASSSDAAMRFKVVPPAPSRVCHGGPAGAVPHARAAAETRRTPGGRQGVGTREMMARPPAPDPAHSRRQEQPCKRIPWGEGQRSPARRAAATGTRLDGSSRW
ncbi:unnamed protein product, partial [Urochloa humidicola]